MANQVAQKKLSTVYPPLKQEGVDFLVAATRGGVGVQTKKITLSGTPHTVTFSDLGMQSMADADYLVLLDGETAARLTVDESTITTLGFDVLGGAAAEVAHVLVVGRLQNQGY
jgi:hypothetical protein